MRVLDNRTYFLPLLGALIALSWFALWVWGQSPYTRFLGHHRLDEVQNGSLLLVFIAGWSVMIVAMMLPTSLPLVRSFHTLTSGRTDQGSLLALLVLGYLCVWNLFGIVIYVGDLIVHHAVEHSAWLRANAWTLGAVTVCMAGLYQFTPLKNYCLDKCRSPLSFIMGRDEELQERTHRVPSGNGRAIFSPTAIQSDDVFRTD